MVAEEPDIIQKTKELVEEEEVMEETVVLEEMKEDASLVEEEEVMEKELMVQIAVEVEEGISLQQKMKVVLDILFMGAADIILILELEDVVLSSITNKKKKRRAFALLLIVFMKDKIFDLISIEVDNAIFIVSYLVE